MTQFALLACSDMNEVSTARRVGAANERLGAPTEAAVYHLVNQINTNLSVLIRTD